MEVEFRRGHLQTMAKIIFSIFVLIPSIGLSLAAHTLGANQSLSYGETLVSSDLTFELGFFTPGNSSMSYLGIWYKFSPETVVWVANRNNPLAARDGLLAFSNVGNLVVLNWSNDIVWSSELSRVLWNPVVQLLDSGNLVLWDNSSSSSDEAYLWQSFDYPSDTLLAGMKLGLNLKRGLERRLTAWKSMDDPSSGDYVYGLNYSQVLPQYELVQVDVHSKVFRTGEWNGIQFFEVSFAPNPVNVLMFVYNETEISFMFEVQNSQLLMRMTLNCSGVLQVLVVNRSRSAGWTVSHEFPSDSCDSYGRCGANAICNLDSCECVKGFTPRSPDEWMVRDFSSGCKRTIPPDCSKGEGFLEIKKVKLPDLLEVTLNKSMSLKKCKEECLKNCSCTAYSNSDIRGGGGRGCLMWYGDLIDMRVFEEQNYVQTLYIRESASELDANRDRTRRKIIIVAITLSSIIGGLLLVGTALWCVKHRKRRVSIGEITQEDIDLPLYDLAAIVSATNSFSDDNIVGAGGFGPVYKGNLQTGQLVAIKRLSRSSGQGLEEFKNEALLIARLQHRNLVGLLGCCIEGEERILLYEYMDNKSLNYFIFDQEQSPLLTWQRRFDIVVGIARGLLYLHHDSKLQVIHRDLKTSNILLDGDLNPKISDFGLARIFGANQKEARTRRVIGTYGYMAPEYAFDGKFSLKSDIYSFGVLLLEIISGKRNRGFSHPSHHHNLLGHAWLLWGEGRALEIIDECLHSSFDRTQVKRCIQVGLLCVQKFPEDRPAMSSAICMILNCGWVLPEPKEPGYFTERKSGYSDGASSKGDLHTQNAVTLTILEGR